MSEAHRVREAVSEAVERGTDAAEELHRAIANVPLDVLGHVSDLTEVVEDVRRVQDRALGAVYDLVRGVNREVGRMADAILDAASGEAEEGEPPEAVVPRAATPSQGTAAAG